MKYFFFSIFILIPFFIDAQIQVYYDWAVDAVKQEDNPLRNRLEEEMRTSGFAEFNIYGSPYNPYTLLLEQILLPVVQDHPDSMKLNVYHRIIPTQGGAYSGYFGPDEAEEAKRQVVIQKNHPSKFYDYLFLRGKHTLVVENEIVYDWAGTIEALGMETSDILNPPNKTVIQEALSLSVNDAQSFFGPGTIEDTLRVRLTLNGDHFDIDLEELIPVSIDNSDLCCDFGACLSKCIAGGVVSAGTVLSLLEAAASTRYPILELATFPLTVADCLRDCAQNPCSDNSGGSELACGFADNTFCYEYSDLFPIPTKAAVGTVEPHLLPTFTTRAECGTCPIINYYDMISLNGVEPVLTIEMFAPDPEERIFRFNADPITFLLQTKLNGNTISNVTEDASGTYYREYSLENLNPGDSYCIRAEPLTPLSFKEDCDVVEKCVTYTCPEFEAVYNTGTGFVDYSLRQNDGGANFTRVKLDFLYYDAQGNIIERFPQTITESFHSGSVPVADLHNIQTVCLIYNVEDLNGNNIDEACAHKTICFDVDRPECTNFKVEIAACDLLNRSILVTGKNGTPPYSYLWNTGSTINAIGNVQLNQTYRVTVTDALGCTTSEDVIMTPSKCTCGGNKPAKETESKGADCIDIEFTVSPPSLPGSPGYPDGSISVNVTGLPGPYYYMWSDIDGTSLQTRTGLAEGKYCIEVAPQGDLCCYTQKCIELLSEHCAQNPLSLQFEATPACTGNEGSLTVSITGNNSLPPYTVGGFTYGESFEVTDPEFTITDLYFGSYYVRVTDGNGCVATGTGFVGGNSGNPHYPWMEVVNTEIIPASGCAGTNGAINLDISASMDLTFAWSHSATTEDAEDLIPGAYSLTITGECGQQEILSFTVPSSEPIADISLTYSTRPANCDGNAVVTLQDGTPPYHLILDDGRNPQQVAGSDQSYTFRGLCPGDYTLSIVDANGCSIQQAFVIETCDQILLSNPAITPVSDNCGTPRENGIIEFRSDPYGGNAPFTYDWSNGATGPVNYNLGVGNYRVTVTDVNGCTGEGQYSVQRGVLSAGGFAQRLDVTNVVHDTDNDCGGRITVHIYQSGYNARLKLLNENGLVLENIFLQNTFGNPIDQYHTFTGLCKGKYTIELQSEDFTYPCRIFNEAEIGGCLLNLYEAPVIHRPSGCGTGNGSIEYSSLNAPDNGISPFLWIWSTGEVNVPGIHNLSPGTYGVTIADSEGCIIEKSFDLAVPSDAGNVEVSEITQPSSDKDCDGSITVAGAAGVSLTLISGGQTISSATMSGPSHTFTNLCEENYTILSEDAAGCTGSVDASLTGCGNIQPHSPVIVHPSTCNVENGSIFMSLRFPLGGEPPYDITLQAESGDFIPSTGGGFDVFFQNLGEETYTMTIEDNIGCTNVSEYELIANTRPQILAENVKEECEDLENGAISVVAVTATSGTLSFVLTGNGQQWTLNDAGYADFQGLSTGNYHLVITHPMSGCSVEADYFVPELIPLGVFDAEVSSEKSCPFQNTGSITFDVTGGNPEYWIRIAGPEIEIMISDDHPAQVVFEDLPAGTYEYSVADYCGRRIEGVIDVGQHPAMDFSSTSETDCPGHSTLDLTVTGGTPPFTYQWTGPDGFHATTQDLTGLYEGDYRVTVIDGFGCYQAYSATVQEIKPPIVDVTRNIQVACDGYPIGKITLNGISGGKPPYEIEWSNGSTQNTISNLSAGSYYLSVTDRCNTHTYGPYTIRNEELKEQPEIFSCYNTILCGNIEVNYRFAGVDRVEPGLPNKCEAKIYCENFQVITVLGNTSFVGYDGGDCAGCNKVEDCTIPSPYRDDISFVRGYDQQLISHQTDIPISPNTGQIVTRADFTDMDEGCDDQCSEEEIFIEYFCGGQKVCDDCIPNPDVDGDCIDDDEDNCDTCYNPGPTQDISGFSCENITDDDDDHVPNSQDNCPDWFNPLQKDIKCIYEGPNCPNDTTVILDTDLDNIPDSCDNCPNYWDPYEYDLDGDGTPDYCDNDPGKRCLTCKAPGQCKLCDDELRKMLITRPRSLAQKSKNDFKVNIYPNPVQHNINIHVTSSQDDTGVLRIVNSMGKVVFTKDLFFRKGENLFSLEAQEDISTGIYTIMIVSSNGRWITDGIVISKP